MNDIYDLDKEELEDCSSSEKSMGSLSSDEGSTSEDEVHIVGEMEEVHDILWESTEGIEEESCNDYDCQVTVQHCQNCRRSMTYDVELPEGSPYRTRCLYVQKESLASGATRRSYANISMGDCDNLGLFFLCVACTGYLKASDRKEYQKGKWTWAPYLWNLLGSIQESSTRKRIWNMLPNTLQMQYYLSASQLYPGEVFERGTSTVKEISHQIEKFNRQF